MLSGLWGAFFWGGGAESTLALTITTAVVMSAPQPSCGTWCLAGLCLCCDIKLLTGLKRQFLSFPALHPFFADITWVSWRSQGTHITEAKPKEKRFTVDYVRRFRGWQFIHPTNLSLKIRPLKLGDNGRYEVVMDTLSDPTKPKTFSYSLRVHGKSKDGGRKVVGTRLGFSPPWACPHGGGLPLCKAPSPEPTHPMTSPPSPGRGTQDEYGQWRNSPSSFSACTHPLHPLHPLHPALVTPRPPQGGGWSLVPKTAAGPTTRAVPCAHRWLAHDASQDQ